MWVSLESSPLYEYFEVTFLTSKGHGRNEFNPAPVAVPVRWSAVSSERQFTFTLPLESAIIHRLLEADRPASAG